MAMTKNDDAKKKRALLNKPKPKPKKVASLVRDKTVMSAAPFSFPINVGGQVKSPAVTPNPKPTTRPNPKPTTTAIPKETKPPTLGQAPGYILRGLGKSFKEIGDKSGVSKVVDMLTPVAAHAKLAPAATALATSPVTDLVLSTLNPNRPDIWGHTKNVYRDFKAIGNEALRPHKAVHKAQLDQRNHMVPFIDNRGNPPVEKEPVVDPYLSTYPRNDAFKKEALRLSKSWVAGQQTDNRGNTPLAVPPRETYSDGRGTALAVPSRETSTSHNLSPEKGDTRPPIERQQRPLYEKVYTTPRAEAAKTAGELARQRLGGAGFDPENLTGYNPNAPKFSDAYNRDMYNQDKGAIFEDQRLAKNPFYYQDGWGKDAEGRYFDQRQTGEMEDVPQQVTHRQSQNDGVIEVLRGRAKKGGQDVSYTKGGPEFGSKAEALSGVSNASAQGAEAVLKTRAETKEALKNADLKESQSKHYDRTARFESVEDEAGAEIIVTNREDDLTPDAFTPASLMVSKQRATKAWNRFRTNPGDKEDLEEMLGQDPVALEYYHRLLKQYISSKRP